MQIAKWGNSLAVRIPAELAREMDLKLGDDIGMRRADDGAVEIVRNRQREDALAMMRDMRWTLPENYRFDREEANAR